MWESYYHLAVCFPNWHHRNFSYYEEGWMLTEFQERNMAFRCPDKIFMVTKQTKHVKLVRVKYRCCKRVQLEWRLAFEDKAPAACYHGRNGAGSLIWVRYCDSCVLHHMLGNKIHYRSVWMAFLGQPVLDPLERFKALHERSKMELLDELHLVHLYSLVLIPTAIL